jgi:hypothetical protein
MSQVVAEMNNLIPGRLVYLLFLGEEPIKGESYPQGWYRFEGWNRACLEEFGDTWEWYAHFTGVEGERVILSVDMVTGKHDAKNLWEVLRGKNPGDVHLAETLGREYRDTTIRRKD